MSLTAFTDSTSQNDSPAFTWRPTLGNSMKTRSVSASTANALMPTVAVFWPPSLATATHSCVLANNKFSGFTVTLLIRFFVNHKGHKGHEDKTSHFLNRRKQRNKWSDCLNISVSSVMSC